MGQREKARAIVDAEYEFSKASSLAPDAVSRAALDAADQCKSLRGSIKNTGGSIDPDGTHVSSFVMSGPGGVMQIMDFVVIAAPAAGGGSRVQLKVGNFLFQKGSLGMKPSINGKSAISKFVTLLRSTTS